MTYFVRPVRNQFWLKRHDTLPGIEIVLPAGLDLTGAVATLIMSDRQSGVVLAQGPCTIVTVGSETVAQYAWAPGDTAAAAICLLEVEIDVPGGGVTTEPPNGGIEVLIDADLGSGGGASVAAPGQMAAPALSGITDSQIVVTLAADPSDGGSPITARDLRYSGDGGASWVLMQGVTSPVVLTGLPVGVTYEVETRALNAVGQGAWSPAASATTVASVPGQMAAPALSGITSSQIVATLAADPANNGAVITGRDVRHSADGGATWTVVTNVSSPVTLSGLSPATSYQVESRAVNSVGAGPWSAAAPATTGAAAPAQMGAPTLSAVGANQMTATLAADPANGGSAITSRDLRYSGDGGATWTTMVGVTSPVVLTGLSSGVAYLVQARAVNGVGAGPWSASSNATTGATAPGQMAAPTLSAVGANQMTATLAADPANGGSAITSRDLRYSGDGGVTWTTLTGVSSPRVLTGLSSGVGYLVQTRAVNAVGAGAWSLSASATTGATAPAQMGAPGLSGITASQIVATLAADPADGGSAITSRDVRYSSDGGTSWTTVSGVTSPVTLNGLAAGTGYLVQARANNAVGSGAWSTSASTTTSATVPGQMGAPTLSGVTASQVVVTLAADPANGGSAITSRDIRYSSDGGTTWTTQTGVTSPVTLSGLAAATAYLVQARANNAVGNGAWSVSSSATTGASAPGQMGAPTLSGVTASQIVATLAADPANGGSAITSRDIRYSGDGGATWTTVSAVTSPATISGLTSGTSYLVQARANNAVGNGAWSPSASATTGATAPAQMGAPTLGSITDVQIVATLPADPADGGSAITARDVRYSSDGGVTWTTVSGVTSPVTLSGLSAATTYQVQDRAVNAIGAGAWSTSASATTSASAATISVNAFSADRIIYDSGIAFGRNVASVPLSGTGTDGLVVQARALSVDDAGATSSAWVDVATIAGGIWSGAMDVPRSASWYKPEVRIKTNTGVTAQGTNRFGVGHVIAIWGQSEISHMANTFYSQVTPVSISDPEALQVYHFTTGFTPGTGPSNLQRRFISNSTPVTAALAAMAATFIASRPGDKFSVILHAVVGTDFRAMVNDGDTSRYWSDDLALHNFATSDGRKVGMAGMSWFAAPGALGSAYADALFPLFNKTTLSGAAVTIPGTITHSAGTYHADHWFGELYNYADTKWLAYGPHRFEINADLLDATHLLAGGAYTGAQNKQDARDAWRTVPGNANATMFLAMGYDPIVYENGRDNGAGGWTDEIHPGVTADGSALWARHNALEFLKAAGMVGWAIPKFDNCYWEPSGAYVEVWSSAGAITTTRLARSEAALPATYPHWTDVFGFEVNTVPVQSATIVSGRVRITKPGGGSFISSDVLTFGSGNAVGQIKYPQDPPNATWKNLPIVNVGAAGVDGIPVVPRPAASVFANTLTGAASFTTVAGQATRFKDTANWPTTGGKMTIFLDMAITSMAATCYPFEMDNTHVTCNVATDGRMFISIKDSAGTALLSSVQVGTVALNTRFTLTVAIDLAANTCWTTFNGTTTSRTLAANSGNLASATRKFGFLSRASGTTGNVIATVYELAVWVDCISGGGNPPTDTNLRTNGRVKGLAATVNAHAWKAGGNVT